MMVAILLAGCALVTEKKVPAEVWIKVGQANISYSNQAPLIAKLIYGASSHPNRVSGAKDDYR